MTPHEKAVSAINRRLERLQANLRETPAEGARPSLFRSIVALIALAEGLNDFIAAVDANVRRRNAALKQETENLAARHGELLKSGQELLEKLKANPEDRSVRKEIERLQKEMETIQKRARRDAHEVQRELAPGIGMIDEAALVGRRFAEAEQSDALKRALLAAIGLAQELHAAHPVLRKDPIDRAGWEGSALSRIAEPPEFHDAYSRAGSETVFALELMAVTISEDPPATAEAAVRRAREAAEKRLAEVGSRLAGI